MTTGSTDRQLRILTKRTKIDFLVAMHGLDVSEPKTLAEAACRRLRADIVSARFKPGEKLRLKVLSELYDIGIGPLREAASRLASTGLVVADGQRGFLVAPISTADLLSLMKARILLESVMLQLAIARGGLEWESEIVAAGHRIGLGGPRERNMAGYLTEEWERNHRRFHAALFAAVDSHHLLSTQARFYELSDRYTQFCITYEISRKSRDAQAEHEAIMDAVLSRDPERAILANQHHILESARTILRADAETASHADELIQRLAEEIDLGLRREERRPATSGARLPLRESG